MARLLCSIQHGDHLEHEDGTKSLGSSDGVYVLVSMDHTSIHFNKTATCLSHESVGDACFPAMIVANIH